MTRTDVSTTTRTALSNPAVPYWLTIIAGVLVILGGLATMAGIKIGVAAFGGGFAMGVVGILLGLILVYSAVRLNGNPNEHVAWGVVIIIFSVVSLVLVGGGFIIGFIFGLVGGILAIAWRA